MPLIWDIKRRRYRDAETNRLIDDRTVARVNERINRRVEDQAPILARAFVREREGNGGPPIATRNRLEKEIKKNFIRNYIAGKGGGRDGLTNEDWGRIGGMLRKQKHYLNGLVRDVARTNLTEGQIRARVRMYIRASGEAYERGNAVSYGNPKLPAHPRDGTSICNTNCKCHWRIERIYLAGTETFHGWRCFWEISAVESCVTCLGRHGQWYPLVITPSDAESTGVDPTESIDKTSFDFVTNVRDPDEDRFINDQRALEAASERWSKRIGKRRTNAILDFTQNPEVIQGIEQQLPNVSKFTKAQIRTAKRHSRLISEALDRYNGPFPNVVWRGLSDAEEIKDLFDTFEVGQAWRHRGFASTSLTPKTGEQFANWLVDHGIRDVDTGLIMEIIPRKARGRGGYIGPLSELAMENEYLLKKNSSMQYLGKKQIYYRGEQLDAIRDTTVYQFRQK